jgi:divalent metal cation (Fe/Co/Zn/Cd) transporter
VVDSHPRWAARVENVSNNLDSLVLLINLVFVFASRIWWQRDAKSSLIVGFLIVWTWCRCAMPFHLPFPIS